MCTAITFKTKDNYFGRTLDLGCAYGESISITPRNSRLTFRMIGDIKTHFAMIGVSHLCDGYPLYYDAVNEKGLAIAGLNFPGNAVYRPFVDDCDNIAQFELTQWLLSQCASLADARKLLDRINLININFSPEYPCTPLHWLIADKTGSITVESVADGLKIYDNSIGVLTNNPPFDAQMFNLNNYMSLSPNPPVNNFSDKLDLSPYSFGMGAMGMPGDLSSMSRFVRASFVKLNSVSGTSEEESVGQFFHILGAVEQQRGSVYLGNGEYELTLYTSCCNMDKGIFYYTTYNNSRINAVHMYNENLDGSEVISYPMIDTQQIHIQNPPKN